jgi:hypothetical protein
MSNIQMKIRKVTALPGTYEASTMYLVQGAEAGLMDIYVSTSDGSAVRHIISKSEINTMITSALSGFNTATVVADITARNALAPTVNTQVLVLDATGDPTVNSGAATYIYDVVTTAWYKISESESLDLVINWSDIVGRPTASAAAIDDAISKAHVHANKTVLDAISDVGGALGYSGQPVRAYLEEEAW